MRRFLIHAACWLAMGAFVAGFSWLVAHSAGDIRKRQDAVHAEGYEAGHAGLPPESCPWGATWHQEDNRNLWLRGWLEGSKARR